MDFDHSEKVERLRAQLGDFMRFHVEPANREWHHEVSAGRYPVPLIERLKSRAFMEGLWNFFLPGLKEDEPGQRLTNLEYAPLAEIMGRVHWASEVFNCSAPDSGNMELLHLFATPSQRSQWLAPLLIGEIRSCFAMSEPDTASSDARNIRTTIQRDGDSYVINGRKWFITGARHPNCRVAIVMGVTGEHLLHGSADRHSMILVPMDTPGLKIVRDIPIMHYNSPEGNCELLFQNVRVPVSNLIGEEERVLGWPRSGSVPGACITACAPSASVSWRWSSCASVRWNDRHLGAVSPISPMCRTGLLKHGWRSIKPGF